MSRWRDLEVAQVLSYLGVSGRDARPVCHVKATPACRFVAGESPQPLFLPPTTPPSAAPRPRPPPRTESQGGLGGAAVEATAVPWHTARTLSRSCVCSDLAAVECPWKLGSRRFGGPSGAPLCEGARCLGASATATRRTRSPRTSRRRCSTSHGALRVEPQRGSRPHPLCRCSLMQGSDPFHLDGATSWSEATCASQVMCSHGLGSHASMSLTSDHTLHSTASVSRSRGQHAFAAERQQRRVVAGVEAPPRSLISPHFSHARPVMACGNGAKQAQGCEKHRQGCEVELARDVFVAPAAGLGVGRISASALAAIPHRGRRMPRLARGSCLMWAIVECLPHQQFERDMDRSSTSAVHRQFLQARLVSTKKVDRPSADGSWQPKSRSCRVFSAPCHRPLLVPTQPLDALGASTRPFRGGNVSCLIACMVEPAGLVPSFLLCLCLCLPSDRAGTRRGDLSQ